jgi:hypothetical protein
MYDNNHYLCGVLTKKYKKMKRIFFAFVLILLTSGIASAQEKAAVISVVDSAAFDFGDIKEADGLITHVFKIKNVGETPLVVTKVAASCGCTTPNWTSEPIAPGKTGEIKVSIDVSKLPGGPFIKTASVYSNGSVNSIMLTMKGKIIPKNK